ncbi:Sigma subunit DNA-directed RNA polymerase [Nitrospira sp. KM1]|uniref:sigma-70 family RNA polymerase sigma factor n=1 Tax=Nitrospira sp. KM1 TaxID=1936990 RepID=UPI0013A72F47|nr:sigma-70 family RNA polymerase sigma factor [Nitrospira sp. KM1]BCA53038.1 Sigma subunit DNA-directed RNA polymerase [Nitrospira sp. KM1]
MKEIGRREQTTGERIVDDGLSRILEHEAAFRGFLKKRLSDETIAEDLFQQSLLRAVEHEHSVRSRESVVAWFYRILRNAVIDYYRSRSAEESRRHIYEKDSRVVDAQEVPSLGEIKGTICSCIDGVLSQLQPNYAEMIRRIDLRDEPIAAVAKNLHISPANATVRLHRARRAFRSSLETACGVCTKHGCLNCTCS